MPKSLKNSLVCWYSPKLQGITNEYLLDGYLSEEGTSILKDLSGNQHDMTIYGMTGEEGNGYVDEDGALVFDGRDDYAIYWKTRAITDYTIFNVVKSAVPTVVKYFFSCKQANQGPILATTRNGEYDFYPSGSSQHAIKEITETKNVLVMTPTYLKKNDEEKVVVSGFSSVTSTAFLLARLRTSVSNYLSYSQYNYIEFSRTLTDTEATWVTTNMINI